MKPAACLLLFWLATAVLVGVVAWYGFIGEALRAWSS
jgi:hypothetical protein